MHYKHNRNTEITTEAEIKHHSDFFICEMKFCFQSVFVFNLKPSKNLTP